MFLINHNGMFIYQLWLIIFVLLNTFSETYLVLSSSQFLCFKVDRLFVKFYLF